MESFTGKVRDECLNINLVWSLAHARVVITDWKIEYAEGCQRAAPGQAEQLVKLDWGPDR